MDNRFGLVLSVVMAFLILSVVPLGGQRDVFFGRRVPPGFRDSPRGRATLRHYRALVLLASGAAGAGILLLPMSYFWLLVALTALPLAGAAGGFVLARSELQRDEQAVSRADSPVDVHDRSEAPTRLPGGFVAQWLPFAVPLTAALVFRVGGDALPETYPIHFSPSGEPNGWLTRAGWGGYAWLGFGVLMQGGLLALALLISRGAPPRAQQRGLLRLLLACEYMTGCVVAAVVLYPLMTSGSASRPLLTAVVLLPAILVVGALFFLVRSNAAAHASSNESRAPSDVADAHWTRGGLIYKNPRDPALMVPKRFGIGYTLNFGHPAAYWIIAGQVAIFGLVALVLYFGLSRR